jgi:hypothetical protein
MFTLQDLILHYLKRVYMEAVSELRNTLRFSFVKQVKNALDYAHVPGTVVSMW